MMRLFHKAPEAVTAVLNPPEDGTIDVLPPPPANPQSIGDDYNLVPMVQQLADRRLQLCLAKITQLEKDLAVARRELREAEVILAAVTNLQATMPVHD